MRTFFLATLLAFIGTAVHAEVVVDATSGINALWAYVPIIVEVAIAAAVAWLVPKASRVLGLNLEAKHREAIEQAFQQAARFGVSKARSRITGREPIEFDLKNEALGHALQYAMRSVPMAIDFFGLSADRVRDMLEARFEKVITEEELAGNPMDLRPGALYAADPGE